MKTIINKSAVKEVENAPLSNNTISMRIDNKSDDILSELKDSLMKSEDWHCN